MAFLECNRRELLRGLGAAAAAAVVPAWLARRALAEETPGGRPNIVLILMDDLGYTDAGFMGSRYYETANIDRLAREGMVFTNAYANGPNCAPTRACLLSGQYTPRHGVLTVGNSDRGPALQRKLIPVKNRTTLPPQVVTIAESLKAAGYATAHVGKWHLGDGPTGPKAQGFDVNVGGNRRGAPGRGGYFSPYRNKDLPDGPHGEYLTDRLTDEAVKFIEANRTRPFFLYLPHYAVHGPLQAKSDLVAKYRKKPPAGGHGNPTYAAMIESADQGIGRILRRLDDLKLTENTVVIFFSDNGGVVRTTSNAPLRGGKGMLYEGGIREPMVVRWPGRIAAGSRCETPVIGTDFYPTLLEIAGAAAPKGQELDGESLLPLLTEAGRLEREAIYWHFPCYLQGSCPSLNDRYFRTRPAGAVRKGDWKLIEFFEDGRLELYNLKDDIGEKKNLAATHGERTGELHSLLKQWRKDINAPMPTRPRR